MLWVALLSSIALGWTAPTPLLDDSEEVDAPCFDPCSCELREGLVHVHCDGRGFTNVSQVSQAWPRPFKLYLQKNSLRRLYFNSFLHLNNAVAINLGNNALQDIHAGAFRGLSAVKRLYLHENKLEVFRNDTFLGLESLEYLQADYNVIKRIDSGAFRNLHKLRVLILNDNLIPALPSLLFRSVSLTHLDLRGNRLKTLTYKGTLEYVGRSLMEIQLEENPWNCACDIVPLQAWLERVPYTVVVGEVTCEHPFHLHGKDLREIKRPDLCPLLGESEVEASLPPYTARARPTKPSSMSSVNQDTASSAERKERPVRPTKRPRPSKTPPTPRSVFPNQPPVAGYQTRPPIPIICPIGCVCNLHINDLGLTVNCKDNGIRNVSELMPRPLNAKKLYLSGNLIQRVYRSDFWNFSSLDLLHLGSNRISYIQDGAFVNLPNLRSLYLNGNNIEILGIDMFYGLQSLRYLYFEYNEIRNVLPATFSLMPALQLLFLNNNLLRTLPAGAFAGTSLARLNLRNNYFRNLPVSGVLEHLQALVQIDLNNNPWDCACDSAPLKQWLDTLSSVVVVGEVACKTPEALAERDLRSLAPERVCGEPGRPSAPAPLPGPGPHADRAAIPLSVLVLSLLVLLVSAFFAAAALCAYALRRREKLPFRRQGEAGLAGLQMECGIFTEQPETPPPPGHAYDSIAPPTPRPCSAPAYSAGPEDADKQRPPGRKEASHFRTLAEKDQEWTAAVSGSPINTVVAVSGLRENGVLCPTLIDSQGPTPKVGLVDSLFGAAARFDRPPDRHPPPEYPRGTGPRTGCPNQTQGEHPDLRARLKTKLDYIGVLERSYQF
ncbi:SLIT and NTRK-like protein 3 [Denticeps clupeoides]|uniref:LRRCT domain-containing protein n=1 Tax=Denticeps clupeoides TaxID=299321 RepID=A0AAY4A533_9TELE|nr:SLIT and NTRK-like protein 3 [Denticeps clupeoides]XP_028832020.1 SLIT and NTRK-like protein 3 [Denticeps clupeoides]